MNPLILVSIIVGLLTAFIYAIQNLAEGFAAKRIRYYELAFVTQVYSLILMVFVAVLLHKSIVVDLGSLLIAAALGAVCAFSLHFYYRALRTGPINIVAPISGSYAIVAIPLAVIFLNEALTLMQYIAVGFVTIGVFLVDFKISKRGVRMDHKKYLFYSFLTLVLWGIYMPLASILIGRTDWFVALFWEFLFASIFLAALLVKLEPKRRMKKAKPVFIKVGLAIALCEVVGGLILNYGLEKGNVTIITPLTTMSTVITVLFATVFLKERLSSRQAYGIACALVGIIFLGS